MITGTGWTWDYIDTCVTLPQVAALADYWQDVPPAAMQLRRIAAALGLSSEHKKQQDAKTGKDVLSELVSAGLPVMEGRPDDPMLNLLDDE